MGQSDKQFQSQHKENQLVHQDDSKLASYQKIELQGHHHYMAFLIYLRE